MNLLCCNVYVIFMKRKRKEHRTSGHLFVIILTGSRCIPAKYILGNKFPISGYCLFEQKLYFCLKY